MSGDATPAAAPKEEKKKDAAKETKAPFMPPWAWLVFGIVVVVTKDMWLSAFYDLMQFFKANFGTFLLIAAVGFAFKALSKWEGFKKKEEKAD
jgi:hypothetical protein